ncbi:hypothetical protein ILYODFUR_038890 [Ilyodon furcidens]|uniref:Uncharacterized protein n=1 Tax=Ilyodon furcidens TaxID=33524 RepID=A0ABV0UBY9_9TELE
MFSVYGQMPGYTLDRSPVHHRATQPHSFTPKSNLEKPTNLTVMFLDCGRKLKYQVRTHAYEKHANSMQKDPQRSRTQDLVSARQQCYQLRHCAALFLIQMCL